MKKKYLSIISLAALFLTGCGKGGESQSETSANQSEPVHSAEVIEDDPYSFSNNEVHYVVDDDIVLDGQLDDLAYKDSKWLSVDYEMASGIITLKMTTVFTQNGFFLAFDVNDPSIYYRETRNSVFNTGIELYMCPNGFNTIVGNAYEVDLNVGSTTVSTKLSGDGKWLKWHVANDATPSMATRVIGAPINTGVSDGYIIEAFFPYKFFGLDREIEYVNMHPAMIRSWDATSESRLWYDFGPYKNGYSWPNPETWWKFNDTGLIANSIKITTNGNGTATSANPFIVSGDTATVVLKPEEGNYIKQVLVDGVDYTDQVEYDVDKSVVTITAPSGSEEDINVEVTFDALPTVKSTLSGTITYNGTAISASDASNMEIKYLYKGAIIQSEVDSTGKYSLSVPSGTGIFLLRCKSENYIMKKESFVIEPELTTQYDIDLNEYDYGINHDMFFNDITVKSTNENYFYNNVTSLAGAKETSIFDFNLKADFDFFNEDGSVKDDPTNGNANHYTGINIYFHTASRDENGGVVDPNGGLQFQCLHWNSTWYLKVWNLHRSQPNNNVSIAMSYGQLKKLQAGTLKIRLVNHCHNSIIAYLVDGNNYFKLVECSSANFPSSDTFQQAIHTCLESPVSGKSFKIINPRFGYRADDYVQPTAGSFASFDCVLKSSRTGIIDNPRNPIDSSGAVIYKGNFFRSDILDSDGNIRKTNDFNMEMQTHYWTSYNSSTAERSGWGDICFSINYYSGSYRFTSKINNAAKDHTVLTEDQTKMLKDGLPFMAVEDDKKNFAFYLFDPATNDYKLAHTITSSLGNYIIYADWVLANGTGGTTGITEAGLYYGLDGTAGLTTAQLFEKFK